MHILITINKRLKGVILPEWAVGKANPRVPMSGGGGVYIYIFYSQVLVTNISNEHDFNAVGWT